jgi:hypothetical protein
VGGVVARILAGRVLPAAVGRRGVREQERPEHAADEAQDDRGGVLDREAARRVRGEGLDRGDLAGERAKVADLVDHVEQDRTAARLAAPGVRAVVVAFVVGLVEERGAGDRDEPAERAALHHLDRARHDRAVPAVMADEDRHLGGVGRLAQPHAARVVVGHRLLEQRRDPRGDTGQRLLDVQLIGRGDDDAVGPVARDQLVERTVERNRLRPRGGLGGRRGIGDRRQAAAARAVASDHLDMALADLAGAGDGDLEFVHGSTGRMS